MAREGGARAVERSRQKVKQLQTFEQWWLGATVASALLSEVDNALKLKEARRRARLLAKNADSSLLNITAASFKNTLLNSFETSPNVVSLCLPINPLFKCMLKAN